MDQAEIETGVREVISLNSRFMFKEINLEDPLDKFMSSAQAARLAREIKRKFSQVNSTQLTNKLFVSIKKVSELVTEIVKSTN